MRQVSRHARPVDEVRHAAVEEALRPLVTGLPRHAEFAAELGHRHASLQMFEHKGFSLIHCTLLFPRHRVSMPLRALPSRVDLQTRPPGSWSGYRRSRITRTRL